MIKGGVKNYSTIYLHSFTSAVERQTQDGHRLCEDFLDGRPSALCLAGTCKLYHPLVPAIRAPKVVQFVNQRLGENVSPLVRTWQQFCSITIINDHRAMVFGIRAPVFEGRRFTHFKHEVTEPGKLDRVVYVNDPRRVAPWIEIAGEYDPFRMEKHVVSLGGPHDVMMRAGLEIHNGDDDSTSEL